MSSDAQNDVQQAYDKLLCRPKRTEPAPFAFGRLQKATKGLENVTPHNAAVGVTSGTIQPMRATNADDNSGAGSVKSTVIPRGRKINKTEGEIIPVDPIALPDVIPDIADKHGEVAFPKMDVEGAELELLEHAQANGLFDLVGLTVPETHQFKVRDLVPRFEVLRSSVTEAYPITKVNLDWI